MRGRRPDDDAAVRREPGGQPAAFRAPAAARRRARPEGALAWARARTSPSLQQKVQRLCESARRSIRRIEQGKHVPAPNRTPAVSNSFRRVLVYFGLAEDRDYYDDDEPDYQEPERELESRYQERPNVRRLQLAPPPRRDRRHLRRRARRPSAAPRSCAPSEGPPHGPPTAVGRSACISSCPTRSTTPRTSRDKFKDSIPVIVNLQRVGPGAERALHRLRLGAHLRARRRHAEDRRARCSCSRRATSRSRRSSARS